VRPSGRVVIAAHRGKRRYGIQLGQHCGVADIAGVDDEVAAAQKLGGFRPQQTVSVGNKPDARHRAVSGQTDLFRAAGGVKGDADDDKHYAEHGDRGKYFHSYNSDLLYTALDLPMQNDNTEA
jgi:hypothetical protein